MLYITIPGVELWDSAKEEFLNTKTTTLALEHSLIAVSKWESRWHKAFLTKEQKSREETVDYIRCMTITQNVDPVIYNTISDDIIAEVYEYINDPMTATTIKSDNKTPNRQIVTSEVIYSWMCALNIPFKCEKWHLNRLITLIQVRDIENSPPKKMSKNELANRNRELNAERRKLYKTKG